MAHGLLKQTANDKTFFSRQFLLICTLKITHRTLHSVSTELSQHFHIRTSRFYACTPLGVHQSTCQSSTLIPSVKARGRGEALFMHFMLRNETLSPRPRNLQPERRLTKQLINQTANRPSAQPTRWCLRMGLCVCVGVISDLFIYCGCQQSLTFQQLHHNTV